MGRVRLRQAVMVAGELDATAARLRGELALKEPFRDPGVGVFGLANTVFSLGDCFLEIVSPTEPGTSAGRQLERLGGDGGYMVIFDIEDLAGARERAEQLGIRAVWGIDLPDIATTHLHPVDMGATIVSLDRSDPYGTWRWGGPEWIGQVGVGPPGELAGVTLAVADPQQVLTRWAQVLGVEADEGEALLRLEDAEVRFEPLGEREEGLVAIDVRTPAPLAGGEDTIAVGSLRVRRTAPTASSAA